MSFVVFSLYTNPQIVGSRPNIDLSRPVDLSLCVMSKTYFDIVLCFVLGYYYKSITIININK